MTSRQPARSTLARERNDALYISDECLEEMRSLRKAAENAATAAEAVADALHKIGDFFTYVGARAKRWGVILLSVLAASGVLGGPASKIAQNILAALGAPIAPATAGK